ncbi:acetyl-CoA acetyltransferase, partial [Baffinella frigidus]
FGGSLASIKAPKLGAVAIKAAVEQAGIPAEYVQEVYFGNVCSAGVGQAPARQAAIFAGLAQSTICTTVNKVCASGTKAIMLAAQSIMLGGSEIVVAGGMESMSNVPFLLDKARFGGYRYGSNTLVDSLVVDGLWDPYGNFHMGECAEKCGMDHGISREEMDDHVRESYSRVNRAIKNGWFDNEIVPVKIEGRKGESTTIKHDEEPLKVKIDRISSLKPAFKPADVGKVTAANSSSLNDGACALVLMSAQKAEELGLKPLARIVSFADAEQAPIDFPTAPSIAIPKALKYAGLNKSEVDLWEINQAFSVVALANQRILDLDPSKVDVCGGAVVLGHPIGCSGARIVSTLLHSLHRTGGHVGVAAICNGGGGASAIVVEAM